MFHGFLVRPRERDRLLSKEREVFGCAPVVQDWHVDAVREPSFQEFQAEHEFWRKALGAPHAFGIETDDPRENGRQISKRIVNQLLRS